MTESNRPASVVERAIAQGQQGVLDPGTVLWVIAASQMILLNDGMPPADEFPDAPLVVARDDARFLTVFTNQDQVGAIGEGRTPTLVPAFELLRRIPQDVGLVVNPGSPLGLEVPVEGLRAFVARLLQPLAGS